jgi:type 1 glutamine amidotransferase
MIPRFWSLVLAGTLGLASCAPAAAPARPSPDTATVGTRAAGPEHRVVLIAGPKSHGPRVHEYIKTVRLLKVMLDNADNVSGIRTEIHLNGWPEDAAALEGADVIMVVSDGQDGDLYSPVPFMATEERMRTVERLMDASVGLITFHFSTFAPDSLGPQVLDWVGGYFDWQNEAGQREWYSAIRTLDTTVGVAAPHHPIARGLPASFRLEDEFYYNLRFQANDPRLTPILSVPTLESDREHGGVVAWAVERADGGRGFGTSTGHFFRNWQDPRYRKLLLNAIVWAAGAEVPQGGVESRFYTDAEVTRALYGASHKALILTGRNHPAHDWALTTPVLESILEADGRVHADVSYDIEDLFHYDLADYDFLLLNYANWEDPAGLSDGAKAGLVEYLSAGGGLLVVHFANGAFHHSLPGAGASD